MLEIAEDYVNFGQLLPENEKLFQDTASDQVELTF